MHVRVIEARELVGSVENEGFVLCLGLDRKEIYFLCDTDDFCEVVKFQNDFTRATGFKVRKHPLSAPTHNEIVRIWEPVEP